MQQKALSPVAVCSVKPVTSTFILHNSQIFFISLFMAIPFRIGVRHNKKVIGNMGEL